MVQIINVRANGADVNAEKERIIVEGDSERNADCDVILEWKRRVIIYVPVIFMFMV